MGIWIFMVIMLLLMPIIMIVFGNKFIKSPPKQINGVYGYRTSMSMKNQETWEFAHRYFGKLWYNAGRFLLFSILLMFFVIGKDKETIGCFGTIIIITQMIFLVGAIILTEQALKRTFDKDGNKV